MDIPKLQEELKKEGIETTYVNGESRCVFTDTRKEPPTRYRFCVTKLCQIAENNAVAHSIIQIKESTLALA